MSQAAAATDLIALAQQGDRDAISRLLSIAQPDIRRYARIACKASDIDDAVQDTLWLLYRRIGTLRAATSLAAWLFTIVHRACNSLARHALGAAAFDDIPAEDSHLITRPAWDLQLDLAAAIQSLPPHYRKVILLRDVEELTIDEITIALGLTREAAKARLHRARAMIREYLKD